VGAHRDLQGLNVLTRLLRRPGFSVMVGPK